MAKQNNDMLSKIKDTINTKYKRSVIKLASERNDRKMQRLSTGSFWLDYAIGGGVPVGRMTAIYGEESTSKTTVALKVIADAQHRDRNTYEYIVPEDLVEQGYVYDEEKHIYTCKKKDDIVPCKCAFIDLEGTFDEEWFTCLGGDVESLEYAVPDFGEQAVDIVQELIRCGLVDVIVIDSLAHLVPRDEVEASAEDQFMGLQARLINKGCRKWVSTLCEMERRPTIITLNQIRQKIGVMFGNPETLPGGQGQKFTASVGIRTRKGKVYHLTKDNISPLYAEMKGKVEKNKTAPPKIEYTFNLAMNDYDPSLSEGEKKYEVPFKKGDILEHKSVITYASKFNMIGKDEEKKKFFINLPHHEEPIYYGKKQDMLNEWIYENPTNYRIVKESLLKIMMNKL